MRSSWKIKTLNLQFFRSTFLNRVLENSQSTKLWVKGTKIFSNLLDKDYQIYNGAKFVDVSLKKEGAGSFLGSFVLTKRITAVIHSKTRKNKKGRRKKKKK